MAAGNHRWRPFSAEIALTERRATPWNGVVPKIRLKQSVSIALLCGALSALLSLAAFASGIVTAVEIHNDSSRTLALLGTGIDLNGAAPSSFAIAGGETYSNANPVSPNSLTAIENSHRSNGNHSYLVPLPTADSYKASALRSDRSKGKHKQHSLFSGISL
ncbi:MULTISPECIES: hypothetical protein [Pseudomonas]|uniref:Uncharacterized protein n=1 Tax=Pseudomonas gingeri TaxID=117681 RepID=A0A7Y7Y0N7_9PSED|nr:hypothetical protein [Pseudomonas gingeri]NWC15804.1 hypothetical protein [Pseudomonas gingeri]